MANSRFSDYDLLMSSFLLSLHVRVNRGLWALVAMGLLLLLCAWRKKKRIKRISRASDTWESKPRPDHDKVVLS